MNKAVVVLVCAIWEAYCEDVASEAAQFLVTNIPNPNALPKPLKKLIAKAIKEDRNELSPWELAGDGWKSVVATGAVQATRRLTGNWNTPKSEPVRELLESAVGLKDITTSWTWRQNPPAKVLAKLDAFVSLRGDIAHRASAPEAVKKSHGAKFYAHIERLATLVDEALANHLERVTGIRPW